jgi:hypothetical protein
VTCGNNESTGHGGAAPTRWEPRGTSRFELGAVTSAAEERELLPRPNAVVVEAGAHEFPHHGLGRVPGAAPFCDDRPLAVGGLAVIGIPFQLREGCWSVDVSTSTPLTEPGGRLSMLLDRLQAELPEPDPVVGEPQTGVPTLRFRRDGEFLGELDGVATRS